MTVANDLASLGGLIFSNVAYLAVGGGGGGGLNSAGGGGAGGVLQGTLPVLFANTTYVVTVGSGGAGGSGVVIISVPTTNYSGTTTGSPTITTNGSNTVLTFTSSGTYTA